MVENRHAKAVDRRLSLLHMLRSNGITPREIQFPAPIFLRHHTDLTSSFLPALTDDCLPINRINHCTSHITSSSTFSIALLPFHPFIHLTAWGRKHHRRRRAIVRSEPPIEDMLLTQQRTTPRDPDKFPATQLFLLGTSTHRHCNRHANAMMF